MYFSTTHQLIIDRDNLVLKEIKNDSSIVNCEIQENLVVDIKQASIELELLTEWPKPEEMDGHSHYLDWDLLSFPLKLRNWKNGDKVKPLGMKGSKKLSDILTDNKVPISDKGKTLVLVSGSSIVSVIGQLIHNDYRITNNTKKVMRIRWQS